MQSKRLILVRHAKAQLTAASDFERVLTEAGEQEVRLVAQRLADSGVRPDRLLTSAAARAMATARGFAEATHLASEALLALPELYLAPPQGLLTLIGRHGADAGCLLVVAHNPGISDLAWQLSGQGLGELPTAAVVQLEWPGPDWRAAPTTPLRLLDLDYPLAAMLRGR